MTEKQSLTTSQQDGAEKPFTPFRRSILAGFLLVSLMLAAVSEALMIFQDMIGAEPYHPGPLVRGPGGTLVHAPSLRPSPPSILEIAPDVAFTSILFVISVCGLRYALSTGWTAADQ
jgi:hypothetical protein